MLNNATLLASDIRLTDDIIISHVLSGKKEEYEILVRRYNSMLYKTARGILSVEKDIEDVMQETYLRGFVKLSQFRKEAKFSTWLTRILINCALQQAHKLKGREHLDIDTLHADDTESLAETPAEIQVPAAVAENLKNAVEGAISQLPSKYRLVFILREVEQTPVAETATVLNISEENVKIRLHRAKGMLKEMLQSELNSLEIFEFHATRCAAIALRVMDQINKATGSLEISDTRAAF